MYRNRGIVPTRIRQLITENEADINFKKITTLLKVELYLITGFKKINYLFNCIDQAYELERQSLFFYFYCTVITYIFSELHNSEAFTENSRFVYIVRGI